MTFWYPIYGLLLLLTFIVYKQRQCWYFIWQLNGWRGLVQQPILWILLICYVDPKSIMTSIHRFGKYFQFPLAIILFDRTLLYVADPVTMEGILTAPECLNKTFMQNGFFANKGLLHAKDQKWKERRKQLNPAFSHNTLISFLGDFNRVANELKHKLKQDLQDNKITFQHIEDLASRAVLEVSCRKYGLSLKSTMVEVGSSILSTVTTMGVATHFTQNDEKGIAWAYRFLMELTALRILKPWYQIDFIFRLLDKKNYEDSQRANTLVQEFVENIVRQKHLEWQKKQQGCSRRLDDVATQHDVNEENGNSNATTIGNVPEQRIFIDQIFHLAELGKMTLQDVMDESQSMVVVSFETVSTCMMNALLCLALNHECQMKLRQEIQQVIAMGIPDSLYKQGPNNTDPEVKEALNNDNFTVTMAHLQSMPYLDMILNESLRLLATVPMNLRNVSKDFQLKILQRHSDANTPHDDIPKDQDYYNRTKEVVVPKGTMIAMDTFNMQRNEDFWGANALKFYPEHFSKDLQTEDNGTAAVTRRHSYAFVPFSKGVRTCIGYRYSIYLSKILLIKLINSFNFTTNVQFEDLEYCESVSLKYRNSKDIHFEIHEMVE